MIVFGLVQSSFIGLQPPWMCRKPPGSTLAPSWKLSDSSNLLTSFGKGLQGTSSNRGALYFAYQVDL